jgi:hypothetical protein
VNKSVHFFCKVLWWSYFTKIPLQASYCGNIPVVENARTRSLEHSAKVSRGYVIATFHLETILIMCNALDVCGSSSMQKSVNDEGHLSFAFQPKSWNIEGHIAYQVDDVTGPYLAQV